METLEKKIQMYKTVEKLLKELEQKKNSIPEELYKYEQKRLTKYAEEQSKFIDKQEKIKQKTNKNNKGTK